MALNPKLKWPTQTSPSDLDYPYGSARNITLSGDNLGTPFQKAFIDDMWGFLQAILVSAGTVPTNTADTARASQYLDSLHALIGQHPVEAKFTANGTYVKPANLAYVRLEITAAGGAGINSSNLNSGGGGGGGGGAWAEFIIPESWIAANETVVVGDGGDNTAVLSGSHHGGNSSMTITGAGRPVIPGDIFEVEGGFGAFSSDPFIMEGKGGDGGSVLTDTRPFTRYRASGHPGGIGTFNDRHAFAPDILAFPGYGGAPGDGGGVGNASQPNANPAHTNALMHGGRKGSGGGGGQAAGIQGGSGAPGLVRVWQFFKVI